MPPFSDDGRLLGSSLPKMIAAGRVAKTCLFYPRFGFWQLAWLKMSRPFFALAPEALLDRLRLVETPVIAAGGLYTWALAAAMFEVSATEIQLEGVLWAFPNRVLAPFQSVEKD